MTCSHARGLLSSVLQGPDRDTPIGADARNVLCTIYAPRGVPEGALEAQLADLAGYFKLFAPDGQLETLILPSPMADHPAGEVTFVAYDGRAMAALESAKTELVRMTR